MGRDDVPETLTGDDSDYPALLFTDDGGAMISGYSLEFAPASLEAEAASGLGLWALKVPAKDGALSFDDATAHSSAMDAESVDGGTQAGAYALPMRRFDVAAESVSIERSSARSQRAIQAE